MLIEQTLDKLNAMKLGAMKLGAMADAFQQQLQTDEAATLGFEERLGLLADAEWTAREQRKLQRRLHSAKPCATAPGSARSRSSSSSAGTVTRRCR